MKIIRAILQILFPKRCILCRTQDERGFCDECFGTIPEIKQQKYKDIISVFPYKHDGVKYSIWEFKFKGNFEPLSRLIDPLYEVMLDEVSERNLFNNFQNPILVPIPLHKNRHRSRGFNQSEIIAYELYLKNPTIFDFEERALVRSKETAPQAKIADRKTRMKNIEGCFEVVNPHVFYNKNIILIDDVTTTGATLEEAMKVLKKSGARNVYAFTIAQ
jgi:competence protein ComFC